MQDLCTHYILATLPTEDDLVEDRAADGPLAPQMLWNWNTVDSCFISSSWRVTSSGMFAGSCIGVLLLVMLLELLRRMVKEYDALLVRKHSTNNKSSYVAAAGTAGRAQQAASESGENKGHGLDVQAVTVAPYGRFRPTLLEQAVRALLHMCQFAVAYFVMLYAIMNPIYLLTRSSPFPHA